MLTWDDVIVGRDGKTLIKHKQFPSVKTVGEMLQIPVDSTFQLVNFFTHFLHAAQRTHRGRKKQHQLALVLHASSLWRWGRQMHAHSGFLRCSTSTPSCLWIGPGFDQHNPGSNWIYGCLGPGNAWTAPGRTRESYFGSNGLLFNK